MMIPGLNEPRYAPLPSKESGFIPDDEDVGPSGKVPAKTDSTLSVASIVCYVALLASLILNVALALALHNTKLDQQKSQPICPQIPQQDCQTQQICPQVVQHECEPCPKPNIATVEREKSRYAGLDYSANGTWAFETPYAQENITAADEQWMAVDISNAFVAFTKEQIKELELPPSLPFPWDAKAKDLYLISSIHSMHCLTVFHRSNLEYRMNHTQTYSTEHILHCLDNVRVDIECHADDTPRFINPAASESTAKTGVGQIRQCRDWSKLNSWAREHDACFHYNQFLRQELKGEKVWPSAFAFCRKDSKYLPMIQKALGKGPDWVPPLPEWPDIDEIQKQQHR